ncbi:hypothetical protein HOE31_02370, partial [bacterium]|nr:hypothetical protein [bacterium]
MKFLIFLIIMVGLVSFFWHEEIGDYFSTLKQPVENNASDIIQEGIEKTSDWWEGGAEEYVTSLVNSLTAQGREKIDEYLANKELNEYGDEEGTMYTGGTPLFNEETGVVLEKYEFLI